MNKARQAQSEIVACGIHNHRRVSEIVHGLQRKIMDDHI